MNITYPNKLPNYMKIVDDKLIRGRAVTSPYRLYQMKKSGVTQIIDLRNTSFIKRPIEKLTCKILGIKFVNAKYSHRMNKLPERDFFEKINNNILSNQGKTYIHCQYGKRRTGFSVAYYEKTNTNKSSKEIIENMINLGYQELRTKVYSKKITKYRKIFDEFINKYFPEELSILRA